MTKNIVIEPLDIMFFRDLKPFSRGAQHYAESVFPPNLSTLYNALRSYIIFKYDLNLEMFMNNKSIVSTKSLDDAEREKLKKEIGTPEQDGSLIIKYFGIVHNNSLMIKCPGDLIIDTEDNKCFIFNINKIRNKYINYNLTFDFLPVLSAEASRDNLYLPLSEFKKYLLSVNDIDIKKLNEINEVYRYTRKTGIQINNNTNIVEEGKLYSIKAIQMNKEKNSGFFVSIQSDFIKEDDSFILGGEMRPVKFNKSDNFFSELEKDDLKNQIKNLIKETGFFRVVLLTDSYFSKGYYSDIFNEIEGAELLSASVHRPVKISGWDIVKKQPKPLYNFVPAGSVYYFKFSGSDDKLNKIFDRFYLKNVSEKFNNYGYGLSIIGGLKNV